MATNSSTRNWTIEHPCPQCGAPVVLEETDRILRCRYCKNRLYISPLEHFKYFLTPKQSSGDLFFLPYWRFRGMEFSFDDFNVESRIIDTSMLALRLGSVPMSLGVRPQVVKLRYVARGICGAFLKPRFPFGRFVNPAVEHEGAGMKRAAPKIGPSYIGETQSLIYSPVFVRGNVFIDAITQSPLGNTGGDMAELSAQRRDAEDQISFLPLMCPRCGWDLEGETNSLVLFCRNCSVAWQSRGPGFESVKFAFPSAKNGGDDAVYLPFWRLDAGIAGLELKSYADLARLANLPRAVPGEWERKRPHFWVPAFKIQPNLFLRLSKSLTVLQPGPESDVPPPVKGILPVTLPAGEAVEGLNVLIASLAVPRKIIFPLLPVLTFSINDQMLVYLRFRLRGHELIQEDFKMSIQASAVTWGRFI